MAQIKVYPSCCTSAFCGKLDCKACPRKPILDEFKRWVEEHAAVVTDKVWCPNVYTATK